MKYLLVFLILPFFVVSQTAYKKKPKVLFIGNSYTYVNNLPQLAYNIALAAGDSMTYDSYAIGGYTFKNHFQDALSLAKINSQPWNYVVLQAQSQEPSFSDGQVMAQTYPFARKLDSVAKANNACCNVVFYETWGRKFGDQGNCPNFPPLCTYTGMQNRLRKWCKIFADSCNATMAPVGEAWRASIAATPTLELYDPDQSHPSLAGSYLAACIFYETLFQRSVLSNTYNPGLPANTLSFLQQTAHNVLRDSLSVWNIGTALPWADFSFISNNPGSFQFTADVSSAGTWYFGDGTTSQNAAPLHVYAQPGTYTVSHANGAPCERDSVTKIVSWISTGLSEAEGKTEFSVYPNPCGNRLFITGFESAPANLEISDLSGRVVKKCALVSPLPIDDLNKGIYFLRVDDNLKSLHTRFVKNE